MNSLSKEDREFEEELRGSGTFLRNNVSVEISMFVARRNKYDPHSAWNFAVAAVPRRDRGWDALLAPGPGALVFRGKLDWGVDVFIPQVQPAGHRIGEFRGTAQEIVIGPSSLPQKPRRQRVSVHLWPTPIALEEVDDLVHWWTGEIKPARRLRGKKQKRRDPKIQFAIGGFDFAQHADFDYVRIADIKSTVVIPRPTLFGSVRAKYKTDDLDKLFSQFSDELDDFARVLTFLSRRNVRWSRMHLTSDVSENDKSHWVEQRRIRASYSTKGQREREPLINPHRLSPDDLNNIYQAYRASPIKQSLASAIIYTVAGYDSTFADSRIANAYTAIEAVVSGLTEHDESAYTISKPLFKKLAKKLRTNITEFADTVKIDPLMATAITNKLPELRRRPIIDQVVDCIREHDIAWKDIWPDGVELRGAIGKLYKRRNRFIHSGQLGNVGQASVDAERLLIITERLIFRLLNGNPAWHDHFSFRIAPELHAETEPVIE